MPKREQVRSSKGAGIEGAIESDESVVRQELNKKTIEKKDAPLTQKTYPSWRKHWNIEAAKRGEKIAPVIEQFLIKRYGLPTDERGEVE